MLLTGLISFIQIIFLPGFILLNAFKLKPGSLIQQWLYIFSFSLICNYILVTTLTLIHIYVQLTLWLVIITESLLILIFYRREFKLLLAQLNPHVIFFKLIHLLKINSKAERVIILIAGGVLLFYFSLFIGNLGTVFYFIDTVNNYEWNNWAIDFANNVLPKYSHHFPQLIPANWSISYVLIGMGDVHFFPKAIMPLFFFSVLLMFADLAYTKKNKVYLIALIIYGLLGPLIYSLFFIADGNADLPVSFFAFLTFYILLKCENKLKYKDYFLVFLFASAAAATKLAGLYTFTMASLVLVFLLLKNWKEFTVKRIFRLVLFTIFIGGVCFFFHLKSPEVMASGLHQPQYLSPDGYDVIFKKALNLMINNLGLPVFIFFVFTLAASLLKGYKKPEIIFPVPFITIVMVLIPTTIWMFKHSHDLRNLSFIVPFLAFTSATGLKNILFFADKKVSEFSLNVDLKNYQTSLNKNVVKILLVTIVASIGFLIISLSNEFYLFLLSIYNFFYRYYLSSARLVLSVEYGFLLHVDFYQRVFISLFSILIVLSGLVLLKVRTYSILAFIFTAVVILNFTFIKDENIIQHQKEAFEKVDARNYYQWIRMFNNNKNYDREVNTNFKAILTDKVSRDINFIFMDEVTESSLNKFIKPDKQIFLKLNSLNEKTKNFIRTNIENETYKVLYIDRDYNYAYLLLNPKNWQER